MLVSDLFDLSEIVWHLFVTTKLVEWNSSLINKLNKIILYQGYWMLGGIRKCFWQVWNASGEEQSNFYISADEDDWMPRKLLIQGILPLRYHIFYFKILCVCLLCDFRPSWISRFTACPSSIVHSIRSNDVVNNLEIP